MATKAELRDLEKRIRKVMATKADLAALEEHVSPRISSLRETMDERLRDVPGTLEELKASARVFDTLLAAYLVERIERIERALKLPHYVAETKKAA